MACKTFAYVRVSSKDQNIERQIIAINKYCEDNNIFLDERDIFIDSMTGQTFDRPEYKLLKRALRSGDTLIIKELDRLGRNKSALKEELNYFKENKIRVRILNIPTTLVDLPDGQEWIFDMINNILIEVLAAIAEDERNRIKRRQKEGLDALRERNNGKGIGRPALKYPSNWKEVYLSWKENKITSIKARELLNLKKTSFYNLVKRYEEEKKNNQ